MSSSDNNCPECGEHVHTQLKNEAGYAKYWFICPGCDWDSRTFRGPARSESEIDDIGYDEHVARFRSEARQEANEKTVSEL